MSRICNLFSGSTGNSIFIGHSGDGILIDAGVSARKIEQALRDIDSDISKIRAVFVTHEHNDHVSGVRVLASRHNIPVYATCGTLEGMAQEGNLSGRVKSFEIPSGGVEVGDMLIKNFATPHDARQSCGYCIELSDGQKIAIATDLGHISNEVRSAITGCGTVVIESNHDIMMLQNGPYPYELKRRVMSDVGHLSNAVCADELCRLVKSGTTRIILAHLSRENNYPALAYETSKANLAGNGMAENIDYMLYVAPVFGGKSIVL